MIDTTDPTGYTRSYTRSRGMIFTFYSFKGGVGRSMALANVAVLLARWGQKVLIVDWDLEAPGLHKFFEPTEETKPNEVKRPPGIIDLLLAQGAETSIDWHECVYNQPIKGMRETISVIGAGDQGANYNEKLQRLDWDELFERHQLGVFLEQLRASWLSEYDCILVDSRTGVSDVGGICTVLLPDALIVLFTSTRQSVDGSVNAIKWARERRARLPVDRNFLLAVPVPSRDESHVEYQRTLEWREIYAKEFAHIYADWIPKSLQPADIVSKLYIPYVAIWSFGETLPVVEEDAENPDPRSITAAYITLAKLIKARLNWSEIQSETALELQQAKRALLSERIKRRNYFIILTLIMALILVGVGFFVWTYTKKAERTKQLVTNLSVMTDADGANAQLEQLASILGKSDPTYRSLMQRVAELFATARKYDTAAEHYKFLYETRDTQAPVVTQARLAIRAGDMQLSNGQDKVAAYYYLEATNLLGDDASIDLIARLMQARLRSVAPVHVTKTLEELADQFGNERFDKSVHELIDYTYKYEVTPKTRLEVFEYMELRYKNENRDPGAQFWQNYAAAAESAGDKNRADSIRSRSAQANKPSK